MAEILGGGSKYTGLTSILPQIPDEIGCRGEGDGKTARSVWQRRVSEPVLGP